MHGLPVLAFQQWKLQKLHALFSPSEAIRDLASKICTGSWSVGTLCIGTNKILDYQKKARFQYKSLLTVLEQCPLEQHMSDLRDDLEAGFPDTGQGPTLQASPSKDSSFSPALVDLCISGKM